MTLLQLSVFYKDLAEMNNAGIGFISLFETIKSSEKDSEQKNKFQIIIDQIKLGKPLTHAFKQSRLLPVFDLPIILSGEKSGNLSFVFEILSGNYQQSALAEKTILKGLVLPYVTLAVALFLPTLPALVAGKISLASYLLKSLGILGLLLLLTYYLYLLYMRSCFDIRLARIRHNIFVELPFLGNLTKKMALEKFTSTLALMLESGLPILEALDHAGKSSADINIFQAAQRIIQKINSGKTLPLAFQTESVFSDNIKKSILLGAESGKTPAFLKRTSLAIRTEVFDSVEKISKAIPVIIYWFVTLYVVFIIISSFVGRINEINKVLGG